MGPLTVIAYIIVGLVGLALSIGGFVVVAAIVGIGLAIGVVVILTIILYATGRNAVGSFFKPKKNKAL